MRTKHMKNIKGITLIALVVTIIILLILAGVTIGVATNGTGLFEKAKLATDEYNNKVQQEETELAKATNEIENYILWDRGNNNANVFLKVLYSESSGASSFNLNDSIDNYDIIEVLVKCRDSGIYGGNSIKYTPEDLKTGIYANAIVYADNNTCTLTCKITVSNNTEVTLSDSKNFYGYTGVGTGNANSNNIWVTKVIGYKFN